jgi:hypothetical protein
MSPYILFEQCHYLRKVFSQREGDLSPLALVGDTLDLAIPENIVRDGSELFRFVNKESLNLIVRVIPEALE